MYVPLLLIEMPQKLQNLSFLHGILKNLKTALLVKVSQISKFTGCLESECDLNSSPSWYESDLEILQSTNHIASWKLAKITTLARNFWQYSILGIHHCLLQVVHKYSTLRTAVILKSYYRK